MDNTDPLFSSSDDQSTVSPDLNDNPDHDFVKELVGEGKKFKDVNVLARSVLHKDMHIKEIERENAELRQAVKQGLSREEFYEAIKTLKPSPSNNPRTMVNRSGMKFR
jgi:ABC-type proline/glycine betaine transport system ATPase subunit